MIDVYAPAGTFSDMGQLAKDLAATFTGVEGVSNIPMPRTERTWVLLTEASEGGRGLWGHTHLNEELVTAARAEIAKLQARRNSRR